MLREAGATRRNDTQRCLWFPAFAGTTREFDLGRMTGLARGVGVDVAALQQIGEASDRVPAISVGFEQEHVLAVLIGPTVIFRQQVDQKLCRISGKPDRARDLPRLSRR